MLETTDVEYLFLSLVYVIIDFTIFDILTVSAETGYPALWFCGSWLMWMNIYIWSKNNVDEFHKNVYVGQGSV